MALVLIWGRSSRQISRCIDAWISLWGEAGEDLSILDIDAGFLESTCPQSYKDTKMLKIAALPDGKDFYGK